MLYIYRERNSTGARELAEGITLQGLLARRTKGLALRTLTPADRVICWGSNFAAAAGTKTLNNVAPISKYEEARKLSAAGVSTITVSATRPNVAAAVRPEFVEEALNINAGQLRVAQARELQQAIANYLDNQARRRAAHNAQPVRPAEEWLARRNNHVGGNDLLHANLQNADYFSKKENIVEEYRIHMFRGKSIRAGKKVQRPTRPDGRTPSHAWIRSFDAGWIIAYENFNSTKEQRELAAKALKALGLDFGAIDIGKRADGSLLVLEVNRAPGVEGGTIEAYAKHIIAWARE